ncbi:MAG: DUF1640 domain-containing protein [Pseudomonadota bacterium]
MATVTFDTLKFDTLKFVEKLRAAGVSEPQAKAQAEVLVSALSEAMELQLATKDDIRGVRADIARLERDLFVVKWMMGLVLGGVTALILKAFFF